MRSGFFNSNITGYDENNNPIYDRAEEASFFAEFFADFIGNGVYPNPSTGMQVLATTGLQIKVQAGSCFINGYRGKVEEGGENITLDTADINFPRIDRIVARLSIANREITLEVLKGAPASNPIAVALTRNSNIYEIALADVTVGKGASTITQANITDTRLNSSLCGMVSGIVNQVDTTTLFNQYQAWFNEMKSTASDDYQDWFDGFTEPSEQEFTTWFDEMKNQLSEDAAGNLQLQIDDIEDKLETLNQDGIIVSPTEPATDRRRVWIKKGKNLLDKNKLNNLFMPASSTSEELEYNTQAYTTNWIECMPNTKYIISGQNRVRWQLKSSSGIITHIEAGTITTTSDTKYIRCYCYYDENNTGIDNLNLQIEQNASVTSYEPYIEPSIYIKNDNGVYESILGQEENIRQIWSGNFYSVGSTNTQYFDRTLESGKLYMFIVKGLSSTFVETIPFIAGTYSQIQHSYSDGNTLVRWRIAINRARTGFYLQDESINMGSNTGILACYKIGI